MATAMADIGETVQWHLRRTPFWFLEIRCAWCQQWDRRRKRSQVRGCLCCRKHVDRLTELLAGDAVAFLRTIRAAPTDRMPRLVFADWLEERGYEDVARLFREAE